MTDKKVELAPVDKYKPRPDATRSEEETAEAEGRSTVDQITDYHETHPTLDASGKEHDADTVANLLAKTPPPKAPTPKP